MQLFYVRQGRNLGNKSLFPRSVDGAEPGEIIWRSSRNTIWVKRFRSRFWSVEPDDRLFSKSR